MQNLKEELKDKIRPVIEKEGLELVDLDLATYKAFFLLRFYVDKSGGVTIDECAALSQKISDYLDVEDLIQQKYTLEVSSPGFDRPLISATDFKRKVGKKIEVFLKNPVDGKKNLQGKLKEFNAESLFLEGTKKEWVIPFEEILKGKIIF